MRCFSWIPIVCRVIPSKEGQRVGPSLRGGLKARRSNLPEIATAPAGPRNDEPRDRHCEERSDEAICLRLPRPLWGSWVTAMVYLLLIGNTRADVLPIQAFSTPSGSEVWLVEDHSSPIVSMMVSFKKSTISSPYEPAALLVQKAILGGAGILSPLEISRFMKETPATISLDLGFSKTTLNIKTTTEGLMPTLKLWTNLIKTPSFQKMDMAHAKTQTLRVIADYKEDYETETILKLLKGIFPKAPIETNFNLVEEKAKALTSEDLEGEAKKHFLSSKPKIMVVGDITQAELVQILEATLGTLPIPVTTPSQNVFSPRWKIRDVKLHKNVPQSIVSFAQPGVAPKSKDYSKYLLLEYVLQGRMFEELREKRGLVYGIQFFTMHLPHTDVLLGNFSCECSHAPKIAKFIRSEWERLKDFGITQRELTSAKLSFKRNKILSLTSTNAVAREYSDPLIFNLGPKAAKTLLEQAEKTSLDEMNRFVEGLLKPELLSFVLLGAAAKEAE